LNRERTKPVVLTIAGLDPSGGAGVIADIRTLEALGCFPTVALTAITFQNTFGVLGTMLQSADTVRAQIEPILQESNVFAVKTGMLPTKEIVTEVVRLVREDRLPAPVVDPVINSTSGFELISDDAFLALKSDLLPLACLITPNIPEAERLTGLKIENIADMRRAARAICSLGAHAVLIKGGHLKQHEDPAEAIDILDDGREVTLFRSEWINGAKVRGTGCTLSAAIAAYLGKGMSLVESVHEAKQYVAALIRRET
jgi:hydroxymethylpyrimidine kinase/phosphomethylpyrimidine kinase